MFDKFLSRKGRPLALVWVLTMVYIVDSTMLGLVLLSDFSRCRSAMWIVEGHWEASPIKNRLEEVPAVKAPNRLEASCSSPNFQSKQKTFDFSAEENNSWIAHFLKRKEANSIYLWGSWPHVESLKQAVIIAHFRMLLSVEQFGS